MAQGRTCWSPAHSYLSQVLISYSLVHCLLPLDGAFVFFRVSGIPLLSFPFPHYLSALNLSPVAVGMAQRLRALTFASEQKQTVSWATGGISGCPVTQ